MRRSILFFIIILTFSCNNGKKNSMPSLKDSLLAQYFNLIDSIPGADTIDERYKMLKYVYYNDTNSLKGRISFFVNNFKSYQSGAFGRCHGPYDSDLRTYQECYRFEFSAAFCNNWIVLSIGKKNDTMLLDYLLFELSNDERSCDTVNHVTR